MERNDELIDKVMAYIREHPEEWDQRYWVKRSACGATACFAGHAMLLSGYSLEAHKEGCGRFADIDHDCDGCGRDETDMVFIRPDGTAIKAHQDDEAAQLLGISEFAAHHLFYDTGIDNVDKMQELIDEIRARS